MQQFQILDCTMMTLFQLLVLLLPLEVQPVMASLLLGKAVGSDGINNTLSFMFLDKPISTARIGRMLWCVLFFFKNGNSSSVCNHQPISLLSCLENVAERDVLASL